MKKLTILFVTFVCTSKLYAQLPSVGIGTNSPLPGALLDLTSSDKGILIPRLTQGEINLMPSLSQGLMVFNITTNSFQYYNGSVWSKSRIAE